MHWNVSRAKLQSLISSFGYKLIQTNTFENFINLDEKYRELERKLSLARRLGGRLRDLSKLTNSKSQFGQDLVVLELCDWRRGGYFVEFGATDGINLSNTYLLEKEFGWTGILVEPDKYWHSQLLENRNAKIDKRCVWSSSGEFIDFFSADIHELSTIQSFKGVDFHSISRENGENNRIETVSLVDLLKESKSPSSIDYLSIDTEGSEYEILEHFDFENFNFGVITVEHNNSLTRNKIYNLLTGYSYTRILEDFSEVDDWYVNEVALARLMRNTQFQG